MTLLQHPTPLPAEHAPEPDPRRVVGVAIPVPEPWGEQLRAARGGYGDPLAATTPAHVTLLPPTLVPVDALGEIQQHLAEVAAYQPPFSILLRGTGSFQPVSEVVFVQLSRGVSRCEQLEGAVRTGPLARTLGFPYHPHVTLAQNLDAPAMNRAFLEHAGFEAEFGVESFSLFEQLDDGAWRLLRVFELGTAL